MYWICEPCWQTICSEIQPSEPVIVSHGNLAIQAFAGWYLRDQIHRLIHALKYQKHPSIGRNIGCELFTRIQNVLDFSTIDYLIPVPLHKKREHERGFNQSHFIALGLQSRYKNLKILDAVHRVKYTYSQVALNSDERRQNVSDAFSLNRRKQNCIAGASIAIIDDVLTTGATSLACASVLKNAGAERVVIITAAFA